MSRLLSWISTYCLWLVATVGAVFFMAATGPIIGFFIFIGYLLGSWCLWKEHKELNP